MSDTISVAFTSEFARNVIHLAQQESSLLWDTVRHDVRTAGDEYFFERLASTSFVSVTTRHADSVYVPTTHSRRRLTWAPYAWGDYVDIADLENMLMDPRSAYTTSAQMALGRLMDTVVHTGIGGTSYGGHAGGTAVTLGAGQIIDAATYPGGLTELKIRRAKKILSDNNVNFKSDQVYLVIDPYQLYIDLLGLTEVKSADYNTIRALVGGDLETWMGCKIIVYTGLTLSATERYCLMYCKSGVGASEKGRESNTAKDPGKNFNWYLNMKTQLGATRIEEEKVIRIECTEV